MSTMNVTVSNNHKITKESTLQHDIPSKTR